MFGQSLGIRDLVTVPVKDIALFFDLGIAAGHIEAARLDPVLFTVVDKGTKTRIGIGCIGVFHGGTAVAESPVRNLADTAGHLNELLQDLFRTSQKDVEDHVFFFIMDGIEGFVVVVMFLAEIHFSLGIGIVIDAIAARLILADIERQILV